MAQDDFGDWDATDSNNTSVTGSGSAININEGMTPGLVNNGMRAMMAAAAISWGRMPSGTSRPSEVQTNGFWMDTTTAGSPIVKFYDGTDDITFFTVDTSANSIDFGSSVDVTSATGGGGLADVVDDTTPQLGGDLDVNSNSIVSASNGDITIEPDGTGDILLNAGNVLVEEDIIHAGDTNNKIVFGTDTQGFETGGTERLAISDSGVQFGASNDIDANTNKIVNVTDPTSAQDAATKAYADSIAGQLTSAFTSTDQTVTSAAQLVLAHSLGSIPLLVQTFLICQTGEEGYTAGDVVLYTDTINTDRGLSIVVDATNVTVRYGSNGGVFAIPNKTTGSHGTLTNANWKLRVRAWA